MNPRKVAVLNRVPGYITLSLKLELNRVPKTRNVGTLINYLARSLM